MFFKKIYFFIFLISTIPLLVSIYHAEERKVYGEYQSKEGIRYISYAKHWDKGKLKALHKELMKNKHGEEIYELKRVFVDTYAPNDTGAYYDESSNSIYLLHANDFKIAEDYRFVLSHEYGHHVQEYYFPSIDDVKDTKWSHVRGLDGFPIHTGCSCDDKWEHKWYLAEIFAEDYVMLYGSTGKVKERKNYNEFDFRNEHENSFIPNVMEQIELMDYLEKATGFEIDKTRLLKKMHPISIQKQVIDDFYGIKRPFLVMDAKQNYKDIYSVEYYQRVDFYREIAPNTYQWRDDDEGFTLRSNDEDFLEEELSFRAEYGYYVEEEPFDDFKGIMKFTYTSFDMGTGLSVVSDPVYIYAKDPYHQFFLLTEEEAKKLKLIEKPRQVKKKR